MQLEERKRKRRCQYDCKDHIFGLQTLKSNSSKYDIKVQFCPKFQRDPLPPEQTYPEFNDDGKYFTSAFVLGVDKRILVKNEQQQHMDHQKQIRDSLEKHNQLVFPRPNSKHSLCSVCKEHYKNYYVHISSDQHRERIGLSSYNIHIKDLCNIYQQLWEGCEEKADEEAEQRALEEEERRNRITQVQPQHQQQQSLLDCQRGSQPLKFDQNGDPLVPSKVNVARRSSKSYGNNDDTVTLNRGYKRTNPQARSAYQTALRKQPGYNGPFNPTHAARERKQRNFERERAKLMKGTQFERFKKEFVPLPAKEGDVFIILRPVPGSQNTTDNQTKKTPVQKQEKIEKISKSQEKPIKKMIEQLPAKKTLEVKTPQKDKQHIQPQVEQSGSASYSGSQSSSFSEIENRPMPIDSKKSRKIAASEEGQLSNESQSEENQFFEADTKKIGRQEFANNKKQSVDRLAQTRQLQNYNYNYPPPVAMPPRGVQPSDPKSQHQYPYKGQVPLHPGSQHYKSHPQAYKGMPPPYYYPYGYPVYDPQYSMPPHDQKDKEKRHDKGYQYPVPHYPWGYPYYMPPTPMPSQHQPHGRSGQPQATHNANSNVQETGPIPGKGGRENPNNPYTSGGASTSINISFPMYMYPPPHSMQGAPPPHSSNSSSRYHPPPMPPSPMVNPYMGYQYPPYSDRNKEGQYRPQSYKGHHQNPSQPQPMHYPQQPHYPPPHLKDREDHHKNQGHERHHPQPYYYPPNYYGHGYQQPQQKPTQGHGGRKNNN